MANPYHDMAKAAHDKKVKAYAGGNSPTAKSAKAKTKDNWDGEKPLNTDEQAGLGVLFTEPTLSKETNPRIMRKAGGSVKGKMSLKRLDRPKRKGRDMGGELPNPEEAMRSAERLKEIKVKDREPDSDRDDGMPGAGEAMRRSGKFQDYKKGGKVSHMEWEHSKADLNQDKKLAKKHGMSMEKWEKSALDKKHDEQQSAEGLKKGGRTKRDTGGRTNAGGKGVNIYINDKTTQPGAGGMGMGGLPGGLPRPPMPPMGGAPGGMPPMMPPAGGMPPMNPGMAPPAPMAPPMGGAPMGGGMVPPPPMPSTGFGAAGAPPRPFKRGGKVKSTQDLNAGAGSGEGRLEKEQLELSKKRRGFI